MIFKKDIQQELRSKAALNSILLFALVTLTAVSFSVGTFAITKNILAALLWVIILFSSLSGFAHVFLKEEEAQTADTLKLIAGTNEILIGKFLFNLFLLWLVLLIVVPLFVAVFNFNITNLGLFITTILLGSLGLSAGGTIVAAIIAKASSRGALFSVLAFPILLPVLVLGISATRMAFSKEISGAFIPEVQVLAAYAIIVMTVAVLLFEFIWNE